MASSQADVGSNGGKMILDALLVCQIAASDYNTDCYPIT